MIKNTIVLFLILKSFFGIAQVEEKTIEVYSETNTAQKVIRNLEKQLTEDLLLDILGTASIQNLQGSLQNKILPQSRKFILSSQILKTQPVEEALSKEQLKTLKENQKFISLIRVRFSTDTLKQILIDENLYYLDKGSNRLLVLIEFEDGIHKTKYRWWSSRGWSSKGWSSDIQDIDPQFLEDVDSVYSKIQSGFLKNGFFATNPVFGQFYHYLPKKYSSLNVETAAELAKKFEAQLFIMGKVKLSSLFKRENQVIWDIAVYNANSLRQVAFYKSRFKVAEDSFSILSQRPIEWVNEVALKINSLYQTGILSTHLFKVDLVGDLSVLERKKLRKKLVDQVQSIENLTVSVIEGDRVQYEADVDGDYKKVVQEVSQLKLPKYRLVPVVEDNNFIVIQVQCKSKSCEGMR